MSRYCRVCGSYRANERFTGRGHRTHICKDCQKLPRKDRQAIDAESEIHGFLFRQSHISKKNLARLRLHCASKDPRVAAMAEAALAAAIVAPYKRRRFRLLAQKHPHVYQRLIDVDLLSLVEPDDYESAIDHLGPEDDLAPVVANDSHHAPPGVLSGDVGQDEIPF
jgi:hypothetical protein